MNEGVSESTFRKVRTYIGAQHESQITQTFAPICSINCTGGLVSISEDCFRTKAANGQTHSPSFGFTLPHNLPIPITKNEPPSPSDHGPS